MLCQRALIKYWLQFVLLVWPIDLTWLLIICSSSLNIQVWFENSLDDYYTHIIPLKIKAGCRMCQWNVRKPFAKWQVLWIAGSTKNDLIKVEQVGTPIFCLYAAAKFRFTNANTLYKLVLASRPLFLFIFGLFKQTLLQFLQQINVKNVHSVSGAGIRTHNLLITSLLP